MPDHWARDAEMRIAPMLWILRVAGPFLRDAHATGKTRVPVDHQQLAVRAVVHAAEPGPVRLVIAEHFGTAIAQHLQIASVHLR